MSERSWSPSRWPLRVRVTAAFASVVALVLVVASALVYLQFSSEIQSRTDAELAQRQATLVRLAGTTTPENLLTLASEPLAQIYAPSGAVIAATTRVGSRPILTGDELAAARTRAVLATHEQMPGTDEGGRLRAFAVHGSYVAVIADSLDGRETDQHRLAELLLIAMSLALGLASLGGYRVAGLALRPVEAMRERAARIGAGDIDERLPEPETGDELQRLAVTLNELLARLQDAVARERRMVGDASHELRTPISVLRTRAEVALRGPDAGLREALTGVVADTERLSELADDLLVLARADQGRLPLKVEPLEAWDLANDAAERADARGARVEVVDETAGGAVVLADAARLAQALDNLLVNAERYGAAPVRLRIALDGDGVLLEVRDSGPGFPPAFLPVAFERFSQADASHGGAGSGLGLAIVQAIAVAHGGSAGVANAPGGGAIARIRLPAA